MVAAWTISLVAAGAVLLSPPASAADPGMLESIDLRVTPSAQGIGGPFEAVVTITFQTDPHATLAVTNLTANLTFTDGLALAPATTDNPVRVSRVDLLPTQSFFVLTYRWNLTAKALGPQNVSVSVTTNEAGGGTQEVPVIVREGIVIGQVTVTPRNPSNADDLHFEVPVSSGFDEATSPLQVWLYVYQSSSPLKPASANRSVVRLTNGDVVQGAGFPMQGQNGTYSYDIPAQGRGSLIYWVSAETPHSYATTKAARILVEDPSLTGLVSAAALAVTLALGALAAAYIVWDPASRKPASHGNVHNSPDRVRLALVVLAIGGSVFAAAVLLGALSGLWHRLGYA